MSFLLDTDICSAYLKGDRRVFSRFIQYGGGLFLSNVSLSELYSWALRSNAPPQRRVSLESFLQDVSLLAVDRLVARRCGEIRAALFDQGRSVGTADLLIAATALVHDLTVVTHNLRHFQHVPELRIEVWLAS
jgi:tRNA(fMet)-specific endonuclease VapC